MRISKMLLKRGLFIGLILTMCCFGQGLAASGAEITIKGSTTVLPIAQLAAEEFMDAHPEVDISVQGGGSGMGIASLLDGTTEIATASRKIKAKELGRARANGIQVVETPIAVDGIAVIIHPTNKLKDLSIQQIRAVYTGDISNWKGIGGKDMKIVVISRDTSSGTFETFEKLALNKQKVRPDALTVASNMTVARTVAQTPGAIGYVGLGYITKRVKALSVDRVECTRETIKSGHYPLARELFIYTDGQPAGQTREFIDYILSTEGQDLVRAEGFIGIR
ncbi:MAG: PstS family phosphate ABC transporter substrate-binding protein [Thermodesulfobacteriota bacterium]|nr:PstS family phosphate ABC transporter substrate-binding protein [Thermodesulfobacteriota bacterium]